VGNSRAATDVLEMKLKNNNISNEDITSDNLSPKKRRNFARGISVQDKANLGIKHMAAIAPSAHHRFDRENVHLRTMFRKLYPNVPNSSYMTHSGLVKDLGSTESLANGDSTLIEGRKQTVPGLAMGGLGGIGSIGSQTTFTRRDTYPLTDKSQRFGVAGIPPITTAASPRSNTNYLLQNTP